MTYNFDPDNWFRNELAALEAAVSAGRLTPQRFESERAVLEEQLEEMWRRLDGSYQLPPQDAR